MTELNPQQMWLVDAVDGGLDKLTIGKVEEPSGILPWIGSLLVDLPTVPESLVGLPAFLLEADTWWGWATRKLTDGFAAMVLVKDMVSIASEPGTQQLHRVMPHTLPDPGVLTTKRQWTEDWVGDYHEFMQLHGFTDERADMMYFGAVPRPGLGEILAGFVKRHGSVFTTAHSSTGYAWADEWLDEYVAANMGFPSVAETIALNARGHITDSDAGTLLSRNNYDPTMTQFIRRMLEGVMSPAEVMHAHRRTTGLSDVPLEELRRIQFDSYYDRALGELSWTIPAPSDYARYLTRTGRDSPWPVADMMRLEWHPDYSAYMEEMRWTIPGPSDVARHAHRNGSELPTYADQLSRVGLHPAYHETIDDLVKARPSPSEFFAFKHRMETVKYSEHEYLLRLGYDPDYWNIWETLSHPLPGVADLVMMAVREVFSPEIAERFGQFEEIPQAYIDNAAKIGLSEEWATNYWAAHWALPSVMQGFDMLHRGIIDGEELGRLFVALDIMPYWREKLTDISYRLLTRVDVRRMYREGVLTYDDTLNAYEQLGYSPLNAGRMADFTVAFVRRQEIGFTRSQVLSAYRDRAIDRDDALGMLDLLGIAGEDAEFALAMEDFNTATDVQNERIKIIETEYKKDLISFEDASVRMDKLEVLPERKSLLLDRWSAAKASKQRVFSKSEIMRYLVNGAISYVDAGRELSTIGYSEDRITVMLSNASMNAIAVRGKRRQLSMADMIDMLATGIIDIATFRLLLKNYGWRDPELSMQVCQIATIAKMDLPEGIEPCTPESVSGMLSRS